MGFCGWWGFLLLEKESPSEVSDCEVMVGCTPPTADVGPLSILKLDHVLSLPFGVTEGVMCTVGNNRGFSVSTVAGNSPVA